MGICQVDRIKTEGWAACLRGVPQLLILAVVACASGLTAACQEESRLHEPTEATAKIGPAGGTLDFISNGRRFTLDVPPGALHDEIEITVRIADLGKDDAILRTPFGRPIGPVFQAQPSGLRFERPATLTMHYDDSDLFGPITPHLRIATSDLVDWELLDRVDTTPSSAVVASVEHFSLFAIVIDPTRPPVQVFNKHGRSFSAGGVHLASSDEITLYSLSVGATSLSFLIEAPQGSAVENTVITIGGLRPNAELYAFDGSYTRRIELQTDHLGYASFQQALTGGLHDVWLQERPGTIHIDAADPDGEDCHLVGSWDSATSTCTLDIDVFEIGYIDRAGIEINSDSTTLDCDGHQVYAHQTRAVLVAQGVDGAQVRNCRLTGGVSALSASADATNVVFEDNEVHGGAGFVVRLDGVRGAELRRNVITDGGLALNVNNSSGVIAEGNTIRSGTALAVGGELATDNTFAYNSLGGHWNSVYMLMNGATILGPGNVIFSGEEQPLPFREGVISLSPEGTIEVVGNRIHGFDTGVKLGGLRGVTSTVVAYNTITKNNLGVDIAYNVDNVRVFLNDFVGNGDGSSPQVKVSMGDLSLELSDTRPSSPTLGMGNYWGHDCGSGPLFLPGTDADSGLVDSNPYGFRVASLRDLDAALLPVPSDCSKLDISSACSAQQASVANTGGPCDFDGDGLLDHEEVSGADVVDTEGNFLGHVDYPGLGANPLVPDIFAEVDYVDRTGMHLPEGALTGPVAPTAAEFRPVIESFARHGVQLHIDLADSAPGTEFDLADETQTTSRIESTDSIWISDPRDDPDNSAISYLRFGPPCDSSFCSQGWWSAKCQQTCAHDPRDVRSEYSHPARRHGFKYIVYGVLSGGEGSSFQTELASAPGPGESTLDVQSCPTDYSLDSKVAEVEAANGDWERFIYSGCTNNQLVGVESSLTRSPGLTLEHPLPARVVFYTTYPAGSNFAGGNAGLQQSRSPDPTCSPDGRNCSESTDCCSLTCDTFGSGTCTTRYSNSSNLLSVNHYVVVDVAARAQTFMHEFGHSLGLWHGGYHPSENYKPNYYSMMNYAYTSPDFFDYSDGSRPVLDAYDLVESMILDAVPWVLDARIDCFDGSVEGGPANQPLNWTCDGLDACTRQNPCLLSSDRVVTYEDPPNSGNVVTVERFTKSFDFDDWSNLNFRGGVSGLQGLEYPLMETPPEEGGTVTILIDVKPDSQVNPVNIKSRGVLPVGILATPLFDPNTLLLSTATLAQDQGGPSVPAEQCHRDDINGDGFDDLLCQFRTAPLLLDSSTSRLMVHARDHLGQSFAGSDRVRVVPWAP